MKKNDTWTTNFLQNSFFKKVFKVMKITVFILLLTISSAIAKSSYSQNTRLTLHLENVTIQKIFDEIQKKSEFIIFYKDDQVNLNHLSNVDVEDATVDQILDQALKGTGLGYRIMDRQIVISTDKIKELPSLEKSKTTSEQKKGISGTVKDSQGLPLPGVSVVVKGTTTGIITDSNGQYSLSNISENSILQFSFIGMKKQEVAVGIKTTINVTLVEETININEVVAVGYGTTPKETMTGAISSVKGAVLNEAPVANVSNSLAGRLSGLISVTGSGEPGNDGSTLRIRGVNTLGDNDVLVVVDGVAGRSLDRIDPNTIESLTILKDASAAIYGSQAANGVILITTKRGSIGKPIITFKADYGFNQPTRIPKVTDAPTYATMINEMSYYNGANKPTYTDEEIQKFKDGSDPLRYGNTNWYAEVLKPWTPQSSYNASISGGSESLKFFVALGVKSQEGNYRNSASSYNQYDFRSNLDGTINKYMTIAFDVSGRMEDKKFPTTSSQGIFGAAMRSLPTLPSKYDDGKPGPANESGQNPIVLGTNLLGYDNSQMYVFNSNLKLNVKIPGVNGLSMSVNASFDNNSYYRKYWKKPYYLFSWDKVTVDANGNPVLVKISPGVKTAELDQWSTQSLGITLVGLINYQTTIAKTHHVRLMLGSESRSGKGLNFSASRRDYASDALDILNAGGATRIGNTGTGSVSARLSYIGRFNYDYKQKYIAELLFRYDGSYNFPEDHRWGFFPGINAGWRISEERFFKENVKFVDNLKLRGSFGRTGNDRIAEWQYLSSFGYGTPSMGTGNFGPIKFVTGSGVEEQTLYETRIGNPSITWEIADQMDVGFESSLFKNKLSIEGSYFYYKRSNVLVKRNASIPVSTGLSLPLENIGKVHNQGFDFDVTYRDRINKLNYSINLNGGYTKNEIDFWDEPGGAPIWQQSTGRPVNTNLYYLADGVFVDQADVDATAAKWVGAKPGDLKFKDVSGDGKIDANDRVRNDKTNIPTITGGMGINMDYKGFDLSILLQSAIGAVNYGFTDSGSLGNYLQSYADGRWTQDNPSATKPRAYSTGDKYWNNPNVGLQTDYFLLKTDYLRLKNLQLGYTLPKMSLSKVGIERIRVYLSGYNLLTFSPDYKDFDPESSGSTSGNRFASHSYPLLRVISAGVTISL
jgi:TonB-linked SusC/RagA family outer membrane protein